jgi:hypothetical protein
MYFVHASLSRFNPKEGYPPVKRSRIGESAAFCLAAISNGLQLANPDGARWVLANFDQRRYLRRYGEADLDLENLAAYLKGKVTNSAEELSVWFAENGWPGINPSYPSSGLGVGSIFDLLVDWTVPGLRSSIGVEDGRARQWYKAAAMPVGRCEVQGYVVESYRYPMFELNTRQSGWKVYLMETDERYKAPDLPLEASGILNRRRNKYVVTKLKFPIVEMSAAVDLDWMVGMRAANGGFSIDEIVKRVRLRLDDKGARAESAVAMTMRGPAEKGVYTIDKPFYVIFWREGLRFPPFVTRSAPDTWVPEQR